LVDEAKKKRILDILCRPACFGKWSCLIDPKTNLQIYEIAKSKSIDLYKLCSFAEKCKKECGAL